MSLSRSKNVSFRLQTMEGNTQRFVSTRGLGASLSTLGFDEAAADEEERLDADVKRTAYDVTAPFESKFEPSEMRQLALVAHNHMKPAMKEFIMTFSEVLKKFRITGTQTTMRMCKQLWGEDDPDIEYGMTCTSGPLGGDAQVAALMCMEDLGALIFFVDPLSAHPHQADIDSLVRLCNCGNLIVCCNPTSAMSMLHIFKIALQTGSRGMIPSFFNTLESPAVAEYKRQQDLALAAAVKSTGSKKLARRNYIGSVLGSEIAEDDDDEEDLVGELGKFAFGEKDEKKGSEEEELVEKMDAGDLEKEFQSTLEGAPTPKGDEGFASDSDEEVAAAPAPGPKKVGMRRATLERNRQQSVSNLFGIRKEASMAREKSIQMQKERSARYDV